MTELKNRIYSLTAFLKSSTLGISKPEGKVKKEQEKTIQKGGQKKSKSTPITPMKGKRLETLATGQSKGNQKTIQCYNCGDWGHGWRECPSKGNFNWRELSVLSVMQAHLEIVEISPKFSKNKH